MDPHQLIEGMVIAGRAGAERGYVYIRGGYRYVIDIVGSDCRGLREGLPGKNSSAADSISISLRTGAGAYSAAKNRRRWNRSRQTRLPAHPPPFQPSSAVCVHRHQQRRDAQLRSGRNPARRRMVRRPWHSEEWRHPSVRSIRPRKTVGIYELPMGFNMKRMIEEVAGGAWWKVKPSFGRQFCPLLTGDEIDIAMDFDRRQSRLHARLRRHRSR